MIEALGINIAEEAKQCNNLYKSDAHVNDVVWIRGKMRNTSEKKKSK